MNKRSLIAATSGLMLLATMPTQAASCYDLWYERNLIYAENGYCFSTALIIVRPTPYAAMGWR